MQIKYKKLQMYGYGAKALRFLALIGLLLPRYMV